MPRLFHQPPKYRLHKSTKQAVVSFFGKVIQLGPYGSERSHKRYRELIGEWHARRHALQEQKQLTEDEKTVASITAESLRQKHKQGLRISIYELIVVYQRHADGYYRKNGKPTREAGLVKEALAPLGEKHGRDQLADFSPVELDNFRDELITDFDWSRKHINKQINRVIAMFKWAAKKDICKGDVFAQLKTLGGLKRGRTTARESKGVSCVADSYVDNVLPSLPEIVADMVRFQRLTGCRPGEVCSLRPCDIDRSGEVWFYRPDAHKTEHYDKDRVVVVGPSAQKVLEPYLLRRNESYCFSPSESVELRKQRQRQANKNAGEGAVFPQVRKAESHDCYQVSSYRLAIRRACKKLEVPVWTPNQLRHTAATEIRKRFGLEAAQVVCGHQTADVTQVYAERDLSQSCDAGPLRLP